MNRTFFVYFLWALMMIVPCPTSSQPIFRWETIKQQRRIPTDTIFIHHTGIDVPMDAKRLSLSHRLRIYHDKPFPGHIRKTQREDGVIVLEQTYVAYHWLIHNDGSAEKLLEDTDVAWSTPQAENNLRSVAICFDGDFSQSQPSTIALRRCEMLIRAYARKFPIIYVRGHREVRPTMCPGAWIEKPRPNGITWTQHWTAMTRTIQLQKKTTIESMPYNRAVTMIPVQLIHQTQRKK